MCVRTPRSVKWLVTCPRCILESIPNDAKTPDEEKKTSTVRALCAANKTSCVYFPDPKTDDVDVTTDLSKCN